jgi:hypothetical protein
MSWKDSHWSYQKFVFEIKTLSFHLVASAQVIFVEVGNPDEMTLEVNTFILAVNSKSIISHRGREYYDGYKKIMIIRHSGGNDGYTSFSGNGDDWSFFFLWLNSVAPLTVKKKQNFVWSYQWFDLNIFYFIYCI